MKLTPAQRRERLLKMAAADPEILKMKKELDAGRAWFEKATARMPARLRSRWWNFPGMALILHQRMLTLICENMQFSDEEEAS